MVPTKTVRPGFPFRMPKNYWITYGTDVSIYFIPDGGKLLEGATLFPEEYQLEGGEIRAIHLAKKLWVFLNYLGLVGGFVGVATLITLTNLLWVWAWLHRREFGIVRTLGYQEGKNSVVVYLLTQSGIILIIGAIIGSLFAVLVVISRIQKFSSFGIGLSANWNVYTIGTIILVTLFFGGIGSGIFPAGRI